MKVSQKFLSYLESYINEITDIPVYGIISAESKTNPRIDIEIVNEVNTEVCLPNARDLTLNIRLIYNPKDGMNDLIQYDLEESLMSESLFKQFVSEQDESMIVDWFRVSKSDLAVVDGNLVISWEAESIIQ